MLADACGKPVVGTRSEEPVLLGSAILGGVASVSFMYTASAMKALSHQDSIYTPAQSEIRATHDLRYEVFKTVHEQARIMPRC
ncbi:FGGY-family carbohydrate kinase [Rhizobium sp. PP-F2F-G48]|uniref:FGGY-family carbohydrate kinase n=1 Tax=Rhizobium sp. PP-F2F-G48 TaxID=2135651 RepID=UPI001047FF60|nr:FGGY-family carbohydrate kinase [Rhizobium sp. PP-F2F-G48]